MAGVDRFAAQAAVFRQGILESEAAAGERVVAAVLEWRFKMRTAGNCDKCGSAKVVPRVRVVDRGDSGSVQVVLARKPDGPIFQREERVDMYARVCGDCGAAALFVEDPQAVYRAHLSSLEATDRRGA